MATKLWVGTGTGADWGTAGNWSPSGVPATGDDVYVRNSSATITAGLSQSAVTLASLSIDATFTGQIGDASNYLQIGATKLRIGDAGNDGTSATGSTRIKINLGTAQTDATVVASASSSADSGLEPIRLIGTHASNALHVYGGRVGVGTTTPGEAATLATADVTAGTLNLGSGVTLTTLTQYGGTVNLACAATTVNQMAGTLTTSGTGAITTVTAGGTFIGNSTGTITTLNVTGVADFTKSAAARTITTPSAYKGSTFRFDRSKVTLTNGLDLVQCGPSDVTITGSVNVNLAFTAA